MSKVYKLVLQRPLQNTFSFAADYLDQYLTIKLILHERLGFKQQS